MQARMDPNHVRIILTPHAPMHMYYYHLLSCKYLHYIVVVFVYVMLLAWRWLACKVSKIVNLEPRI